MRRGFSSSVKVCFPKFSKGELLQLLRNRIEPLSKKLPLHLVALFGSYAEGNYTAASDVDLLVVYEDPKREDAYGLVWDAIGLSQLQLHLYTASEYEELKRSSPFPAQAERGVVLFASERSSSNRVRTSVVLPDGAGTHVSPEPGAATGA